MDLFTQNKAFGMAMVGKLAIVVYPRAWIGPQFVEAVDLMQSMRERAPTSLLVFANGQGPSASERAMLAQRVPAPTNAPPMRQALLTDQTIMRGALSAISWLVNKPDYQMKAFTTRAWRTALSWLQVTATFDPAEAEARLRILLRETGAGTLRD